MFRPQDLTIGKLGGPANERGAQLEGRVQHREFLGNIIRYAVAVGDHVILVDDSHHAGRQVFEVGDNVALDLDIEQALILRD
jgi:iron(III) transport system ATP-binding protein